MQRRVALEEEEAQEERRNETGGSDTSDDVSKNRNATTTIPSDPAALFSAHFALVHLQLRSVFAGLALASALNRTLVLPRIWCGADRWFAPHLGSIPGAAGPMLPFRCPADHVLDLDMMDKIRRERLKAVEEKKVEGEGEEEKGRAENNSLLFPPPPVRESGLLSNPRTPWAVKEDILHVVPCQMTQGGCEDGGASAEKKEEAGAWRKKLLLGRATSSSSSSSASILHLRSGLDDARLFEALSPYSHRRVVSFSDAPASFGGFADSNLATAFERSAGTWASTWCCVASHPGHVWYDSFSERVPHVDRWGRGWDRPWAAVAGP